LPASPLFVDASRHLIARMPPDFDDVAKIEALIFASAALISGAIFKLLASREN